MDSRKPLFPFLLFFSVIPISITIALFQNLTPSPLRTLTSSPSSSQSPTPTPTPSLFSFQILTSSPSSPQTPTPSPSQTLISSPSPSPFRTPIPSPLVSQTLTPSPPPSHTLTPSATPSQSLSTLSLPIPSVPALFVIGDSTVDCGTNNFLGTLARADRPPYGRDFDTHRPTGRFSNGRIPVDYLALRLGLPFVPSYLGQTGSVEDMIHGVNYASAGAGIIFSSGSELGQHISLTEQTKQVRDTLVQFALSMGEEATSELISSSVFYISIGTNDYIHYYLRNVSSVQSLYLPWKFNQFLRRIMKQEIKTLYEVNVRRIVVTGLPPIGCAPYYLLQYGSENGDCIEEINDMIMEFNFALRFMVAELAEELDELHIIFCDVFEASMDIIKNHDHYGFNVTTDACCGIGKYRGLIPCLVTAMACENASTHLWWDQFHPTDAVNKILADNIWSSLHTEMCYPMNLLNMLARGTK